ncbi:LemA family protein [Actinomarinicola tropica]|uniref:RING-type E3 ubiquitin transferase n=1 Tax=Actinomarinicola tropica TaxID=2789776 RepID=A0A5Q2RMZ7_9ACTN|nr:LemA family protein [Actinomarinicola tropica]QGG95270.1 hypothetical protein GH723_09285 [Actinomarinicola tropica]
MGWAVAGLVASLVAVVVGGGFGYAMWRRLWDIADTPTSDAAHVFVGTNELRGRAAPLDRPIVAPYAGVECVWFRSLLEREERDAEGRRRWRTVHDESSAAPFWIEDDSGRVLIRPEGASVYATERRRASHAGRPSRTTGLDLLARLAAEDHGLTIAATGSLDAHRSTEWLIRPGEAIYVLGEATLRDDAVALEFRRRPLIAAGDEDAALRRTALQAVALLVMLLAGVVGAVVAAHALGVLGDAPVTEGRGIAWDAAVPDALVGVAAVLVVLPVSYVVRLRNRLVDVHQRARAAWALVEVQLRRRHDLVPQVTSVVRAAMDAEQAALLAAARTPEEEGVAADALLALAESHPELRTDAHAGALFDDLRRTEDGLAAARTFYNDAVTVLRDRRQQMPGRLLAWSVPGDELRLWGASEPPARPAQAPPPALEGDPTSTSTSGEG